MNKTKSKAAYTNKWLSRNKHLWHEVTLNGVKIIILDRLDAPKIVIERVEEINHKRGYSWSINTYLRNLVRSASNAKQKAIKMSIYTEEELIELVNDEFSELSADVDVDDEVVYECYEDDD